MINFNNFLLYNIVKGYGEFIARSKEPCVSFAKYYEKIGINVPQSKKFLVLPWGRWSITPEYKLFLKMVEYGFLDKDSEFDKEAMREILDIADEILNKRK